MDFYDYIASCNTNASLAVLKNWSNIIVRDPQQLAEALRAITHELSLDRKQVFLAELAEIHPDRNMIEEIIAPEPIEDFSGAYGHSCNCPHCAVKFGANGQQAVGHFMSNGDVQSLLNNETKTLNTEINNIRQTVTTDKAMNDKIFKLVMMAALAFVLFKILKK